MRSDSALQPALSAALRTTWRWCRPLGGAAVTRRLGLGSACDRVTSDASDVLERGPTMPNMLPTTNNNRRQRVRRRPLHFHPADLRRDGHNTVQRGPAGLLLCLTRPAPGAVLPLRCGRGTACSDGPAPSRLTMDTCTYPAGHSAASNSR